MKQKSVLFMLDPFIFPRLEGISEYARRHNWILIPEDRITSRTDYARFDGALSSLRGKSSQLAKVKKLLSLGKPVVDLTVACNSVRIPRVSSDHQTCGKLAAEHLRSLGIDSFAWYSSTTSRVNALRLRGFARQLGTPPALLSPRSLRDGLKRLRKPLAVAAYSETDAEQVILECKKLSLDVPDMVAVIGIGNDPFLCENREITISSIDTNLSLGGYEAARLLDSLIKSPRKWKAAQDTVKIIPPQAIIARKSTDTLTHSDPFVKDILSYIHQHLDKPFGAKEISAFFEIPRTSLDRQFRKATGHSIGREILDQRIRRAKQLLRDKSIPIKAVATDCGFCNQAFLTTVFKNSTGRTPAQWRKRVKALATFPTLR